MDALLSTRRRRLLGAFAALGAATLGAGCAPRSALPSGTLRFGGATMGSTYHVRIAGAAGLDEAAARVAVESAFDAVVGRMSGHDAASELSRFNAHASREGFALSAPTLAVLRRAQQVASWTDGAFDVTVAPLVRAWGFGAGASVRGARPSDEALRAPVGWRDLALDADGARKADPALQLDLSGIAKGHAVDLAALALDALGVARYMVEAGGEVRTRGLNAQGRPWQIAIERPDAWPQQVQRIVPLEGLSMATSGDYRNFYELDGVRIHHAIDPATRAPAAQRIASVSVLHADCTTADALATALMVMGRERGLALADGRRIAALFVERGTDGTLREVETAEFAALRRG